MNIYFLHANNFKEEHFEELLSILQVKEIFQTDFGIDPKIDEICKGFCKYTSYVPQDPNKVFELKRLDAIAYQFTNRIKKNGYDESYDYSSSDAIENLENAKTIDDQNILVIIPQYEHRISKIKGNIYGFSEVPKYIAQLILNILRRCKDDRFVDRIGFLWIDSHLYCKGVTCKERAFFIRITGTMIDINSYLYKETFKKERSSSESNDLREYYIEPDKLKSFNEQIKNLFKQRDEEFSKDLNRRNEGEEAYYEDRQWNKTLNDELNYIYENGGDWILD